MLNQIFRDMEIKIKVGLDDRTAGLVERVLAGMAAGAETNPVTLQQAEQLSAQATAAEAGEAPTADANEAQPETAKPKKKRRTRAEIAAEKAAEAQQAKDAAVESQEQASEEQASEYAAQVKASVDKAQEQADLDKALEVTPKDDGVIATHAHVTREECFALAREAVTKLGVARVDLQAITAKYSTEPLSKMAEEHLAEWYAEAEALVATVKAAK